MTSTNIDHVDRSYTDWLHSLDSYRQELGVLKDRLTAIAGRDIGHEAAAAVEQYENQLIVQRDNIERLRQIIRKKAKAISQQAGQDPAGHIDGDSADSYQRLSDEFAAEEKAVNELRQNFDRFSAKWN